MTAWSPFNYNDSKQLHVLSVYLAASSWLVLGLTWDQQVGGTCLTSMSQCRTFWTNWAIPAYLLSPKYVLWCSPWALVCQYLRQDWSNTGVFLASAFLLVSAVLKVITKVPSLNLFVLACTSFLKSKQPLSCWSNYWCSSNYTGVIITNITVMADNLKFA